MTDRGTNLLLIEFTRPTHSPLPGGWAPAQSADRNSRAAQDARAPVELKYCEGAGHAATATACSPEWGVWVTSFLTEASS